MEIKLLSITHNQLIQSHKRALVINEEPHIRWLIYFTELTVLKFENQEVQVDKETLFLCKQGRIYNSSKKINNMFCVSFLVPDEFGKLGVPYYLPDQTFIVSQIQHVLQKANRSMDDIGLLGQNIAELYKSYFSINFFDIQPKASASVQYPTVKHIDSRLIKINRYIRKHFSEPLTLPLLAELIDSNPVYLSNMFSKIFKISPMKFLQSVRMKKARSMIIETDMTISDISRLNGYISSSQFSATFKRYFKQSPHEFRIFNKYK